MTSPLLSVQDLGVEFRQGGHVTVAVEGVSFDIDKDIHKSYGNRKDGLVFAP